MSEPTLVQSLATFAAETTYQVLPVEVVASARQRVLDTVGVGLAAWSTGVGDRLLGLLQGTAAGASAAPIGLAARFPVEQAAFISGTLAHGLDFDDTHLPSILHPSAMIVPTALTVAQSVGASPRELLAAMVTGYEICARIGNAAYDPALRNSVFFDKGLHGASIIGAIAAAAVAGKLYGGSAPEIGHAMGIAASMAAGLLEANRTGGTVKQLHGGWACQSAVWAARLAAAGYTAPPTVLEGRFGFFHALCDDRYDPHAVTQGLGQTWETTRIFFKPYPANHFTHAGIDGALAIRRKYGPFAPDDIARIELGVAEPTLRTIAEPREAKIHPESGYAARFSGPFTVATALIGGGGLGVYLDDFTDALSRDRERLDLAAKVVCRADPTCDAVFPFHFPAVLTVTLKGGRVLEERVMVNRGSPDWPLSPSEVERKFHLNASRWIDEKAVGRIAELSERMEEVDDLGLLVSEWARR